MMRAVLLLASFVLAGCGGNSARIGTNSASSMECAPFARQVTGLQLYGDAASWWEQAEGLYTRSSEPAEGGVLVFARSPRLSSGHVSVVARQVSSREILVTQANWVHHRITRNEPVLDVSPGNDWSQVRVWWAPANVMGSTIYPIHGFIAPARRRSHDDPMAGLGSP